MTIDEAFSALSKQMLTGAMTHEALAEYYQFLNLNGYKRFHEYHYLCEVKSHRKLVRYYIDHYNKLIPKFEIAQPKIIPDSWYGYMRKAVDTSNKRNAVKTGVEAWLKWEIDTRDIYQTIYKALVDMEEIAAARLVGCFIDDVNDEVKYAECERICLENVGYDIIHIIEEQKMMHDRYKKKMEKMK